MCLFILCLVMLDAERVQFPLNSTGVEGAQHMPWNWPSHFELLRYQQKKMSMSHQKCVIWKYIWVVKAFGAEMTGLTLLDGLSFWRSSAWFPTRIHRNTIFKAIKLKRSEIKASDEPPKFLLEWCIGSVNLYHSLKSEHFCVGGWGKETQPSSNMANMGSPPSYTRLSVLRMCLAQVAGRWGNTWHSACFPNVSVWDKRDESPERK